MYCIRYSHVSSARAHCDIGVTCRIRSIDLCGCGDAFSRYDYRSDLLKLAVVCFSAPAKGSEVTADQQIVFVDDFVICKRREPMTTCDYVSRPTQRHQSSSGSKRCLIYAEVPLNLFYSSYFPTSWWRGTVVERRSLTGDLSLSCARPAADG